MDEILRASVGIGDHILFQSSLSIHFIRSGLIVGKIVSCPSAEEVVVQVFNPMTSQFLQSYVLPPITRATFSMASQACMQEVVAQDSYIRIGRADIMDIAFVVPLDEVECGLFNLCGASNVFFIRYCLKNSTIERYALKLYYSSHPVEPLSIRLFHSLNHLAGLLRKALYHQGEAETSSRSFRLFFSAESFCYLRYKLDGGIALSAARKQATVIYLDSLSMETVSSPIVKTGIKIVTKQGLADLRGVLGTGIGLGMNKRKPTKRNPVTFCTVGSHLTSVEVGEEVPLDFIASFSQKYHGNLIELLYTEETRQLSCRVNYSKIIVNEPEAATQRMPAAEVRLEVISGAYVSANFLYNGRVMTIHSINNDNIVTCKYMPDDADIDAENWHFIELPLHQVESLVAAFGR